MRNLVSIARIRGSCSVREQGQASWIWSARPWQLRIRIYALRSRWAPISHGYIFESSYGRLGADVFWFWNSCALVFRLSKLAVWFRRAHLVAVSDAWAVRCTQNYIPSYLAAVGVGRTRRFASSKQPSPSQPTRLPVACLAACFMSWSPAQQSLNG
mgnify:FL=1